MNADSVEMPHITSEELAGYLEHRLDRESERRVEAHMAECFACRADLVQIRGVLGALPATRADASRHRAWPRPAWLAAAALVGVALVPLARRVEQQRTVLPALRAAPNTSTRIAVVEPDSSTPERGVDPERVVFTWRAVEGAGTYRITITDSAGTPFFTAATTDTSIAPPSSRRLVHGGSYLWYVDALRNDGTTWSTGVRSFTTTR
jgi:anti-sigma factor RsiW